MRPRFFAPSASDKSSTVTLASDEAHHLRHVLRLGVGADISVFDGRGREWTGRVVAPPKAREVTVELVAEIAPVAEPPVRVTLGIGMLKGDQMDVVMRDATMLGVAEVVPVASEHVSVPARAWRNASVVERWQRIAVASAKQCGRAVVPVVTPVRPFETVLNGMNVEKCLMCVEPAALESRSIELSALARPLTALGLVGPEGGWSSAEIDLATRRGAKLLNLGPRTIRAETAPTVFLSSLWTIWGW
jgi:16S rRNA (uracil1498-N3)-methyltransferase